VQSRGEGHIGGEKGVRRGKAHGLGRMENERMKGQGLVEVNGGVERES